MNLPSYALDDTYREPQEGGCQIHSDEVTNARLGDCPAVEALTYVVDRLWNWLDERPDERRGRDTNPYRNWGRFRRGGRR